MDPATWWGNPFFSTLPDMQLLEKQFGVISNATLSSELKDELLVLKPHSFFVSDEERRQSLQVDGVMSESKNFKQAKTIFLEMVEIFFDRLIHVMNIVTTVDVKWQEFFFFRSWSSGIILSLQRIEFFHDIFVLWHHLYKQKKSITNQQKILKVPLCHSLINFFTLHFLNVDSTLIGVPVSPSFLQSITESSSSSSFSSSSSSASSHASFVSTTYDFPILKCEFALQSLILQKSQSQFTSSFSTTKREKRSETILKSFKKPKKESIISSSSSENTKPISQYFAPGMQNPLVAGKSRFFPGQIVIVPIETPSGSMHVFGRISDYVVVEKISVYIDPSERDYERVDEASIIEIPKEWVHRITDLGVIEKWVEDPLEKFKKELTQQITSNVFDFLSEKLGLPDISFLQKVDQTPNEVTIDEFYQLKALDELLDELKGRSRPVALINNIQTAHSRSMSSFEAQYTASPHTRNPAAVFFASTLKQRLQAYRNFSVETQLYAVLAQFKKKCNEASAHLEEELQRVINGERKRELTKWWLELINSSCQSLLQSIGFYKDSLPIDYFSEPPKDLKIVRRNTVLLGEVLNPHRDKHAVKLMVNRLKDLIYTRIELFVCHGFIALSVKLDLPSHTTELAPIKEKVKQLMEDKTMDEGLLKKMDDLIKDMEYLQEMQEMEQLSSGPQASNRLVLSNVVPISGLIIGYFFRQENIFKTTLELWDKTYQKPKPTPAPTPAPVEAETKPEAQSEPVSEETQETPVDQQVESKSETESPSEPSNKDGSDQNPPDSSSSSSSSSSDSRDPSPEPPSPSPSAEPAAPAKTTSDIMARFQLLKKQREAQRAQK